MWKVIYVLLKCNHRIAHILRYSKRDDNLLTFVRLASCVMIRDHKDNTIIHILFFAKAGSSSVSSVMPLRLRLWDGETVIWKKTVTPSEM